MASHEGIQDNKPKTGSGNSQPKGTRMVEGNIKPVFRTADGKKIETEKK